MLARLFQEEVLINSAFPRGYKGYAADIGACDGEFMSCTYFLELRGWDVLCVEANPLYGNANHRKRMVRVAAGAEDLDEQDFTVYTMGPNQGYYSAASALHPNATVVEAHRPLIRDEKVIKVPVRTLNRLLTEAEFPKLDFLCCDTEGGDMDVLRGLDLDKWTPRLIMVENWWDDERFTNYLKPYGYGERTRIGVNDCFIRQ